MEALRAWYAAQQGVHPGAATPVMYMGAFDPFHIGHLMSVAMLLGTFGPVIVRLDVEFNRFKPDRSDYAVRRELVEAGLISFPMVHVTSLTRAEIGEICPFRIAIGSDIAARWVAEAVLRPPPPGCAGYVVIPREESPFGEMERARLQELADLPVALMPLHLHHSSTAVRAYLAAHPEFYTSPSQIKTAATDMGISCAEAHAIYDNCYYHPEFPHGGTEYVQHLVGPVTLFKTTSYSGDRLFRGDGTVVKLFLGEGRAEAEIAGAKKLVLFGGRTFSVVVPTLINSRVVTMPFVEGETVFTEDRELFLRAAGTALEKLHSMDRRPASPETLLKLERSLRKKAGARIDEARFTALWDAAVPHIYESLGRGDASLANMILKDKMVVFVDCGAAGVVVPENEAEQCISSLAWAYKTFRGITLTYAEREAARNYFFATYTRLDYRVHQLVQYGWSFVQ